MSEQTFSTEWGGKTLTIKTGKYASPAGGSCLVQYGETVVLATATMSSYERDGMNFFPLMVDFEERLYAAGRIKGSRFMKREGRPTDEAVLTSRMIDRALRPLFDQSLRREVQVILTCLAFDQENDPDIVALIGASCALHMSNIPWAGPLAGIRVGSVSGEWVINPTQTARQKSALDLTFAALENKVIMVEAGANIVDEQTVIDGFEFGLKHIKPVLSLIKEVRTNVGKEKWQPEPSNEDPSLLARKKDIEILATTYIKEQIGPLFFDAPKATKAERAEAKSLLKQKTKAHLIEQGVLETEFGSVLDLVTPLVEEEVMRSIIEEDRRVDGRGIEEIRFLESEVGVLPRVHGSAHFSRGETQVMSIVTLGGPGDEQTLDGMRNVEKKRYFHHYNFPPFSVGETKPLRGPSRRDIGHGGLAEKALLPVLPDKEQFPYAIRVMSEVLSSNGSSSMGSTCGSTLSLMDAGVPITAPVAGIAMGLATDAQGRWKIITDLQDLEDGEGGMDFKIAGTKEGITALQMDTKTHGITTEMLEVTIKQSHNARLQVLENMTAVIAQPRAELSPYAPRIITIRINPELIGDVIGPGGKMINEIIDTTGVGAIDIEDDGLVMITSTNAEGAQKAKEWIEKLTKEYKAGDVCVGRVTRLMDFGAFVEIAPKKEGLVHVSELAPWRVEKVGDIVKLGDTVHVVVTEIDAMGRLNLSMKRAEGNVYPEKPTSQTHPSSTASKPPKRRV